MPVKIKYPSNLFGLKEGFSDAPTLDEVKKAEEEYLKAKKIYDKAVADAGEDAEEDVVADITKKEDVMKAAEKNFVDKKAEYNKVEGLAYDTDKAATKSEVIDKVTDKILAEATAYHASAETNREKYKEEITALITALTEALKEGATDKITKADTDLNAKLTKYKEELNNLVLVIHDKKNEIDEALKPHKDSEEYQKILASADDLTNQKLTFDKKYQNIKSRDTKDKKKILSLYICNFVVILILLLGCALVFMEKKLPISKFLPKKMRNNKNNSRNNNANNN